ncbi:MAG: molybdopterin-dependent oxidoreductase [Desulfurobacteriaceae bacterium]
MGIGRREFLKKSAALTAASFVGINLKIKANGIGIEEAKAEESLVQIPEEVRKSSAYKVEGGYEWVRGVCRFCGTGCKVWLGFKNGKPAIIRGERSSAINQGFLCMKGMLFYKLFRHPDRLTQPLYRKSKKEPFRPISWEKAFEIIADEMIKAMRKGGYHKNAMGWSGIAYYGSGQCLTEETYLFQKLWRCVGSNHVEGNPRLCMASAVGGYLTSYGADEPAGGFQDLDEADTIFIIGSNTAEAHPIVYRRIMKRKLSNPQEVMVINADPRVSPTSKIADIHLQFKPGTDLALLNAMAYVIIEEGLYDKEFVEKYCSFHAFTKGKDKVPLIGHKVSFEEYKKFISKYTPEYASQICGGNITPDLIRKVARRFATTKTVTIWTMGINQRIRGVWANNLITNLHLLTGNVFKNGADSLSLTGQPNACGGVREGGGLCHILPGHRVVKKKKHREELERIWGVPKGTIPPKPGYHTVKMFSAISYTEEDKKRFPGLKPIYFIWVNETSPLQSLPNVTRFREGFAREDVFVVVTDIFPTRTSELANVILPCAFHFEKTGVYGCTERRSQLTPKAVKAPGQAMPENWIVVKFAEVLARKLRRERGELRRRSRIVYNALVKPYKHVVDKDPWWELPKTIWTEYSQKCTKGKDNDLSGATYEVLLERPDGVQWPAPTVEIARKGGTRRRFVVGLDPIATEEAKKRGLTDWKVIDYGPLHKDSKFWIWCRPYKGAAEEPDAEYPFYLSTGRVIDHWHTASMTGRIPELMADFPTAWVEIHPKDAQRLGIQPGDLVLIETRRGQNIIPARISTDQGPMEGMVFVYWYDQAKDRMINFCTKDAYDPGSKEPEFKICACRIKKYSDARPLKPFLVTLERVRGGYLHNSELDKEQKHPV